MPTFGLSIRDYNGDHHENAGCMALYDDNEATMSVRGVIPDVFLYRFVRTSGDAS
jgi:hypothetical protein